MARRSRWTYRLAATAAASVLLVGGVAAARPGSTAVDEATASALTSRDAAPVADVVEPVDPDTTALDAIDTSARWSVAVLDADTGSTFTSGDSGTFDTASIVKVDVLVALLAQQDGELTSTQASLASAMIRSSDNAAATALLAQVGGADALDAFNATLGLDDTDVSSTWGLTQTTPSDQVRLLAAAFGDDAILSTDAQATLQGLMSTVIDTQRFGVSAADDDPATAALKVGYLQRSATGLWDVTSIGVVEHDGRTYYVAVLSDGSASLAAGEALLDQVAVAAVDAVGG